MTKAGLAALMDEAYRGGWAKQMNSSRPWTEEECEVNAQAMYAVLDALSATGLAVVPKEPTMDMVIGAVAANSWEDAVRYGVRVGDLLRKEEPK
jgi:hypothetical protein